MVVGKVNATLQSHFEKVGETMAEMVSKGWIKDCCFISFK